MKLTIPGLLNRFRNDKTLSFVAGRYGLIGLLVASLDITTLQSALKLNFSLVVATSCGYFVGVTSHFMLNKYFTFKVHSRPVVEQVLTYAAVVTISWIFTLTIVLSLTRIGVPPLESKIISLVIKVPYGFLAHRYITFDSGIVALVSRLRRSQRR